MKPQMPTAAMAALTRVFSMLALVSALAATPAWAGESEVRANAIYKEAKDRFDAKDFEKAADLAEQAERIFGHPAITLLKGRALRALGKLREAESAYKVVREGLAQLPKPLVKVLTDELLGTGEEMRQKGELKVTAEPASARAKLDGTDIPLPFVKWIGPGRHKVEAGVPGKRAVTREVEIKVGETVDLRINLNEKEGRLIVVVPNGLKGALITIDGAIYEIEDAQRLGDRAPPKIVEPGKHSVVCVRDGRQVGVTVDVGSDQTVEAGCMGLEPPASAVSAGKAMGWGGVAVGTGLLGYGLYGLGSYLLVDVDDVRGIKSTNKHWLGSTYAIVGAGAAVASYLLLVRDGGSADSKTAGAAPALPPPAGQFAQGVGRL